MAKKIKLTLTEDMLKLIANIQFKAEEAEVEENDHRKNINYYVDMNSLYGGNFVLEDISFILGIYDKHIEGTEEDALGPKFPKELEDYMFQLHSTIVENINNIEEILHQFVLKGAVTPGTYVCDQYVKVWSKEEESKENNKK